MDGKVERNEDKQGKERGTFIAANITESWSPGNSSVALIKMREE